MGRKQEILNVTDFSTTPFNKVLVKINILFLWMNLSLLVGLVPMDYTFTSIFCSYTHPFSDLGKQERAKDGEISFLQVE